MRGPRRQQQAAYLKGSTSTGAFLASLRCALPVLGRRRTSPSPHPPPLLALNNAPSDRRKGCPRRASCVVVRQGRPHPLHTHTCTACQLPTGDSQPLAGAPCPCWGRWLQLDRPPRCATYKRARCCSPSAQTPRGPTASRRPASLGTLVRPPAGSSLNSRQSHECQRTPKLFGCSRNSCFDPLLKHTGAVCNCTGGLPCAVRISLLQDALLRSQL